jgi:hypothetical protein
LIDIIYVSSYSQMSLTGEVIGERILILSSGLLKYIKIGLGKNTSEWPGNDRFSGV